jgi:uncharacterized integral membrane protein
MQVFLFIALILAFALVLFAVQNSTVITLAFVTWKFEGSLAFILALVFAVGMLTGIFLAVPTLWRKARENRSHRKRIKELERERLSFTEQKGISELDTEH